MNQKQIIIVISALVIIGILVGAGIYFKPDHIIDNPDIIDQGQNTNNDPDDDLQSGGIKLSQQYLVNNQIIDVTGNFPTTVNDGKVNGDYWLLAAYSSGLYRHNGENLDDLSNHLQTIEKPKIYWNGSYWIIIESNRNIEQDSHLYRYDGKTLVDLTDKMIADRIDTASFLKQYPEKWLLAGNSKNPDTLKYPFKAILKDENEFKDISSNFGFIEPEELAMNLVSAGNNKWLIQLYNQFYDNGPNGYTDGFRTLPDKMYTYLVDSEGTVKSLTDTLLNGQIYTIDWIGDRWLVSLLDGKLLSYDGNNIVDISSKVNNKAITAIQSNIENTKAMIFGGESLFLYDIVKDSFQEIILSYPIKQINWHNGYIALNRYQQRGTIGVSDNGWLVSGGSQNKSAGQNYVHNTYYIEADTLKIVDLSISTKRMPIKNALWNKDKWLLIADSLTYEFRLGSWSSQLPSNSIATADKENIFLIKNDKRHPIKEASLMEKEYSWGDVIVISNDDLMLFQEGVAIEGYNLNEYSILHEVEGARGNFVVIATDEYGYCGSIYSQSCYFYLKSKDNSIKKLILEWESGGIEGISKTTEINFKDDDNIRIDTYGADGCGWIKILYNLNIDTGTMSKVSEETGGCEGLE